ncbi:MAG: 4Fe-4S cluster-binding domain-containing protein [Lachnospiraceae bacterium]|nr:4Fe-4S cluster-binding domain-containing protein [Lachnospiraceae bacterium]
MELTRKVLEDSKNIIIYGASVYGELALRGLEMLGKTPICFADRARAGRKYLGYPVIKPDDLVNHRQDLILIASADFYYEILNFLEGLDCENIYDISLLLQQPIDLDKVSHRAKEMYDARENYFKAAKGTDLTIVHLGFCVSERCSLKCKDCSFLMQYYQHPQNIDLEFYKPALDRFIETIDYISEFRIYGGEPFMNPDMYKLLKWYKGCEKINTLSIYTNGTIIPNARTLESMKSKKVKVHISNYGHNMDKVDKLVKVLEQEGITYFERKYDTWCNAGDLSPKNHTGQKLEEIYSNCFATNCYSFLKGKFYACPRAAHAVNLEAMPDVVQDRVDFNNENLSIEQLQQQLRELMHNRRYIAACAYCDGLDNHVAGVKPAVQIKEPLEYKRISDNG